MALFENEQLRITRHADGVPHIKALNERSMYFGIGYCHAIDRGMQLLFMRILGTGTASNHLSGDDQMLEIDKFFRRMNWHSNPEAELRKVTPANMELLQAYCSGIEAGFAKRKPWEFKVLLGYKDYSWSPEDVVLLVRMTGYLTMAQSQGEIERLIVQMIQKGVEKEFLEELFPGVLGEYDTDLIAKVELTNKIVPDEVKWAAAGARFMASNNWVISGARTETGFPNLANDPHLEINRLPPVWYEISCNSGDQKGHGFSMPGLPILLIGRSTQLSWGATYAFIDAIDSWIEQCRDGQYFKDGQWHPFNRRVELIERKKGASVEVTFYENVHGTLEGDPVEEGYYLATRWSGDQSGARSLNAGFDLWNATSVQEAMSTIGQIESAFSWVLADSEGNIGMQMSGQYPVRPADWSGLTPRPGWDSQYDWQGMTDPIDLPRAYNPDDGYIITANNNLNHLGAVSPIDICMGAYRADRIASLIASTEKVSIDFQKSIHYDTYSLQAELFMEVLRPLIPATKNGHVLKEWDLHYSTESKGAYLFEMFYRELYSRVFGKVLGEDVHAFLLDETGIYTDFYANFDRILLSEGSRWFEGKTRETIYREALEAIEGIMVRTWGEFNSMTLEHLILGSRLPRFMGFDRGPYPLRGGRATVHQGQLYRSAGRTTSFAPSVRFITDMGSSTIHTNMAGGVSDRRFSKLYNSDFENWETGVYRETKLGDE